MRLRDEISKPQIELSSPPHSPHTRGREQRSQLARATIHRNEGLSEIRAGKVLPVVRAEDFCRKDFFSWIRHGP